MRRLLHLSALVVLMTVINLATIALVSLPRASTLGPPPPLENGDCNGDGSRDIADAIYLLGYLFSGGPEPVAIATGPALTPEQEEILGHMSIEYLDDGQGGTAKTIRFTGVNVQIVNGLGATNGLPDDPNTTDPAEIVTNGLGNLIVGYNELGNSQFGDDRTGSHNLAIGRGINYESVGGAALGLENVASGPYSSVTGGHLNRSEGQGSSITGGQLNVATGNRTSVTGGSFNLADGESSWVGGGLLNHASSNQSCVTGGRENNASGSYSSIGGGQQVSIADSYDWAAGSAPCTFSCP